MTGMLAVAGVLRILLVRLRPSIRGISTSVTTHAMAFLTSSGESVFVRSSRYCQSSSRSPKPLRILKPASVSESFIISLINTESSAKMIGILSRSAESFADDEPIHVFLPLIPIEAVIASKSINGTRPESNRQMLVIGEMSLPN